jgi:ABC-type polysaccharide/polyol phosphate transport system ATPase subunit
MAVIEFEHVSKAYRLGASRTSLREAMTQMPRKLFSRNGAQIDDQLFWALNDVSFRVEQGEVLGIIGHNGAGKSTILKLLSRVTFPTHGHIRTQGRMAALIELGAGFHPDLSGRENIYLNGSILGLKRREIDDQFSNIVEFAGLERFIDTPVKRYSSGMYVRLAFAVAAHVKVDLLLVDEVLSVGDMAFQQKCLAKMNELRDSGATIVFISHNMWSVSIFCKRVLLLREGRIEVEGTSDEVIQLYRQQEREKLLLSADGAEIAADSEAGSPGVVFESAGDIAITRLDLLDAAGNPAQTFQTHDRLIIRLHYAAFKRVEMPYFVVRIRRADGVTCCRLTHQNDKAEAYLQGQGIIEAYIDPLQLVPDLYTIEAEIVDSQRPIFYDRSLGERFRVEGHISESDHKGVFEPHVEWLPQQVAK